MSVIQWIGNDEALLRGLTNVNSSDEQCILVFTNAEIHIQLFGFTFPVLRNFDIYTFNVYNLVSIHEL